MNEQELREAFEAYGQVQEISIVRDRDTGRSRGFAFVEMPTDAEAQAAITALNGKEYSGARNNCQRGTSSAGAWLW